MNTIYNMIKPYQGGSIEKGWWFVYKNLRPNKIETVLSAEKLTFWQPLDKMSAIKNKMVIIDLEMNKQFILTLISLLDIKNDNKTIPERVIGNVLKFIKRKYPSIIKPLGKNNDRLKNLASYYAFRFINAFVFTFMTLLSILAFDTKEINILSHKGFIDNMDDINNHEIWGFISNLKEFDTKNSNIIINEYIINSSGLPISINNLNSFCNVYLVNAYDENKGTLKNRISIISISNKEDMSNYYNVAKTIMKFFNYMSLKLTKTGDADTMIDYVKHYSKIPVDSSKIRETIYRILSSEEEFSNKLFSKYTHYTYGFGTYNEIIEKIFDEFLTDDDYADALLTIFDLVIEEFNNYASKNKMKLTYGISQYNDSMLLYCVS
ncbi:MAG: hypothetical protein QXF12_04005 [Candidatus Aenigmatarchaeota archaeon]